MSWVPLLALEIILWPCQLIFSAFPDDDDSAIFRQFGRVSDLRQERASGLHVEIIQLG